MHFGKALKIRKMWAEVAQLLRAVATLPEDPASSPSTQLVFDTQL